MPFRSFAGIQTIQATPQPVFGTMLSGAAPIEVDKFSGNANPGSNAAMSVVPVTSTIGFLKNDRLLIGPRGGPYDQGQIFAITPGVSFTVQGLTKSHAAAEIIILDEDVAQVTIIPQSGNAGVIYIGNTPNVSINDPSPFDMLPPAPAAAQPSYWHNPPGIGGGGGYKTSEYWVTGTLNDKFLARISVL